MPRRTNPWPAFVDLFAALLVATFAGFIMLAGAYQQEPKTEKSLLQVRKEIDTIFQQIRSDLDKEPAVQKVVSRCGEDICIDLFIYFPNDKDQITQATDLNSLHKTCVILRTAIDRLPLAQKKEIALVIEGHTDENQSQTTDQHERATYNWKLSARRAVSVAYEFQQCGLQPPAYNVVAIGYADSDPLCLEKNEDCWKKNRRTTLRLRADTRRIETRLKQQVR